MHGTVLRPFVPDQHQRLFERACPGPVDTPHRARLNQLLFWVQNYRGRWAHSRRCFVDMRWSGKVYCRPDETWDTTVANGRDEVLCRQLDYRLPKVFFKKPALGFFLLWLAAYLELGPTWEDSPPKPQQKNIKTYLGGEAPFHHVAEPSANEAIHLFQLFKAGDMSARNMLVAGHIDAARKIARRLCGLVADYEDLEQEAVLALFRAVDKFDPERGASFKTFAHTVIEKDLIDWLRKNGKSGRLRRHVSSDLIAEKNDAALGPYASNSVKASTEYKIFRGLFGKT
jgi:hypothetical protein